jgi:hypothetical protein
MHTLIVQSECESDLYVGSNHDVCEMQACVEDAWRVSRFNKLPEKEGN